MVFLTFPVGGRPISLICHLCFLGSGVDNVVNVSLNLKVNGQLDSCTQELVQGDLMRCL